MKCCHLIRSIECRLKITIIWSFKMLLKLGIISIGVTMYDLIRGGLDLIILGITKKKSFILKICGTMWPTHADQNIMFCLCEFICVCIAYKPFVKPPQITTVCHIENVMNKDKKWKKTK